jgi:hypothetical protein
MTHCCRTPIITRPDSKYVILDITSCSVGEYTIFSIKKSPNTTNYVLLIQMIHFANVAAVCDRRQSVWQSQYLINLAFTKAPLSGRLTIGPV